MSRSGYSDDLDNWTMIRWRGAVVSAMRGARGKAMLQELLDALDAMPVKRLIAHELQDETGAVCALGALGLKRGLALREIEYENAREVAKAFGIAHALAAEIEFMNDDFWGGNRDDEAANAEARWHWMRNWVADRLAGVPE